MRLFASLVLAAVLTGCAFASEPLSSALPGTQPAPVQAPITITVMNVPVNPIGMYPEGIFKPDVMVIISSTDSRDQAFAIDLKYTDMDTGKDAFASMTVNAAPPTTTAVFYIKASQIASVVVRPLGQIAPTAKLDLR